MPYMRPGFRPVGRLSRAALSPGVGGARGRSGDLPYIVCHLRPSRAPDPAILACLDRRAGPSSPRNGLRACGPGSDFANTGHTPVSANCEVQYTSRHERMRNAALAVPFLITGGCAPTQLQRPVDEAPPREAFQDSRIDVIVRGEVAHPGTYGLEGNSGVLEAIKAAGGLTFYAGRVVSVHREKDMIFHSAINDVENRRSAPPPLKSGDVILIWKD
jgi:hypothetical protein